MKKSMKSLIIFICILLILIAAAGLFAGNYFYNLALNPASDKSKVLEAPHNEISLNEEAGEEGTDIDLSDDEWFLATSFRNAYLTSYDGLKLHGTIINAAESTNRWAVLCHGYAGYGLQMTYSARKFHDMGYHVLLPDARGCGDSEGNYIGMGWHERIDITNWAEQLISENGNDIEIILYGVSMGGATVMMASGEKLPVNVKAIVEDCGYSSVKSEFSYQLKELFGLPSFPVINFASIVTKFRAGFTLGEASALDQVKKSEIPMLFIHGDEDTFVPSSMVYELYEAASCEKEIYVVEGAGHGQASRIAGAEYWQKTEAFISKFLIN